MSILSIKSDSFAEVKFNCFGLVKQIGRMKNKIAITYLESRKSNLPNKFLWLKSRSLLKRFEIEFLISSMLVDYEEIWIQTGNYKAQVKLANYFHLKNVDENMNNLKWIT